MSKLKKKLKYLDQTKIKKKWETLQSQEGLTTKEKLEKLVNYNLKRTQRLKEKSEKPRSPQIPERGKISTKGTKTFITQREYYYPMHFKIGRFHLSEWKDITIEQLALIFGDTNIKNERGEMISPMNVVFFDTETTGISGGTGTIPFMLGFGYFKSDGFYVTVYILTDISKEGEFLEAVDQFLEDHHFCATVTYNGKSFDFPLMETRYILQRRRFPLLQLPHLDFLYPARTIWKHTYESRKLGYLGDVLLGLSRAEDIDASQIPSIYFNFLRTQSFQLIEKVVEHNALDLVGLASLVLLAAKYQENISFTGEEGEILGMAKLYEKNLAFEQAQQLYNLLIKTAVRDDIKTDSAKGLAALKKSEKLHHEAMELWQMISASGSIDRLVLQELAIHFEHREKNYGKALEYAQKALNSSSLTPRQREDFEKRLSRLKKKLKEIL